MKRDVELKFPVASVKKQIKRKKMTYKKEDPKTIQNMFGTIAKQYDRTNAVLSFQMHRIWNRELVRKVVGTSYPENFLDLCCGTGEIAFHYLKNRTGSCEAFMLDFCPEMLECAREKANQLHLGRHLIHYLQADAQKIPLPSNSISCATMAYGIRNIKDPSKSAQEVYRVLKPGGTFGIVELTQPKNRVMRFGHSLYLKYVLPVVGKFLTSNQEAYTYLCNSIHAFIPPEKLIGILQSAGFREVQSHPLTTGIATIITGKK
jgi:demethylmenaquinone methyltransferase/2-methoxy-6-polyprenyl-1,4-benzoquinol methylase